MQRTHRADAWLLGVLLLPTAAFVISTLPGVRAHTGYDLLLDGWLNNIAYAAAPAVCAVRAWRLSPHRRRFGMLLASALAVYGSGNVVWTIWIRPMEVQPFPSAADALWLAFYPMAFVVLVLARGQGLSNYSLSEWLDGLVGGMAAGALAAAVLARPLTAGAQGSWAAVATTAAYPFLDLVLLLIIVTTLSLFGWRPPRGVWLLTTGMLLFAVADARYLLETAEATYESGGLTDAVWVLAVTVIALSPGGQHKPNIRRLATWAILVVPTLSSVVALTLLVLDRELHLAPLALMLCTGTIALVLVRLMATIREVNTLANSRALALTDELTGLGNRRALYEGAPVRIAQAPPEVGVALLLLDLDRFKEINDSLGHSAGDTMLRLVAKRLIHLLGGPAHLVARLGGDEFAVLMTTSTLDEVLATAHDIRTALSEPARIDGISVWVGASVGIAWSSPADADLPAMLRQADVAMYKAKSTRVGVLAYSPDADDFTGSERLDMIDKLRTAVLDRGLEVHYQPKIDTRTRRVRGVEALVRWQHPTRGLLAPDTFLTLAEDVGLMGELTRSVLRQSLDQLAAWRARGRDLSIAINLSASSLIDLELPDLVRSLLAERHLPASCLEIEITEEFLMSDRDRAREILGRLREQGVRIAVDDYGTGYSSLAYLKELPVDELKLDKSFVRNMMEDPRAMAIVASTIGLAHSLGMEMVAEGVEDAATAAHLASSGCDVEQGWLYSKAVPAAELEQWLDAQVPDLAAPETTPRPATDVVPEGTPAVPRQDRGQDRPVR
jgi:diguanylate cyclase (GGDEF)-like protein